MIFAIDTMIVSCHRIHQLNGKYGERLAQRLLYGAELALAFVVLGGDN